MYAHSVSMKRRKEQKGKCNNMTSYNAQISHGRGEYSIQVEFDNYDNFLEVEKKIREIMDRKEDIHCNCTDEERHCCD